MSNAALYLCSILNATMLSIIFFNKKRNKKRVGEKKEKKKVKDPMKTIIKKRT